MHPPACVHPLPPPHPAPLGMMAALVAPWWRGRPAIHSARLLRAQCRFLYINLSRARRGRARSLPVQPPYAPLTPRTKMGRERESGEPGSRAQSIERWEAGRRGEGRRVGRGRRQGAKEAHRHTGRPRGGRGGASASGWTPGRRAIHAPFEAPIGARWRESLWSALNQGSKQVATIQAGRRRRRSARTGMNEQR